MLVDDGMVGVMMRVGDEEKVVIGGGMIEGLG